MDQIFHGIELRALKEPMTPDDLWRALRTCITLPILPQELSHYIRNAEYDVIQFEDCIERLRERQAVLRRNIARYSSLLSPIRKLPTEILRRIFGFACVTDPNDDEFRGSAVPFHLSGVCGRWRELVLNSPELWADISLDLEVRTQYSVNLILERSRQHPLSLRLSGGWDDNKLDASCESFGVLLEHAARWREVDFTWMSPVMSSEVFVAIQVPMLETIALSPTQAGVIFHYFSHSYRLRNVIYGEGSEGLIFEDTAPWDGVRHLELPFDNTSSPKSVFQALRLGHDLKTFVYYGQANVGLLNSERYVSNEERSELVESNLETLSIQLCCANGFYALLHNFIRELKFPSLNNLTISYLEPFPLMDREELMFSIGSWPRDVFLQFLDRSGCTLTTLALEGMLLEEMELALILRNTPFLRSFTFCESFASSHEVSKRRRKELTRTKKLRKTVTKSFLRRLEALMFGANEFSTQSPLLPKLTYLKIGVQSHFDTHRAFVDMVKSQVE
ncbi:hypothetical protein AAF712_012714 [Marasmius tenuissimus]|uniref:F-box domain-containing protein n=1 Tax=Marasmius tenuissimus TaxID=585030 RepID=A0ABR2ZHQ1_9AGAR